MKQIIACICVLMFIASCVPDVSPEPSGRLLYKADALTIFVTGSGKGIIFSVLFFMASLLAYAVFEKMHGRPLLGEVEP